MQKAISILKNEEGTVMVIALLILALLTIIGISGTNTTVTELQIVGNDARYRQNFYRAEAAVMEAAQMSENAPVDTLRDRTFNTAGYEWLTGRGVNSSDMTVTANWNIGTNCTTAAATLPSTMYSVVEEGVVGGSLDVSGTQLYEYTIYGLCNANNGESFIVVGYKMRF
jgi:Tfp pilus assembly protein PilX